LYGSEVINCKFYGDTSVNPDCPADQSYCLKYKKIGILNSMNGFNPMLMHPTKANLVPYAPFTHKNPGGWGGYALFKNNLFKSFKKYTK